MGASGSTIDSFYASRSRTGGRLPFEGDLAWITLALVLLLGASLQFATNDTRTGNDLAAAYGIATLEQ